MIMAMTHLDPYRTVLVAVPMRGDADGMVARAAAAAESADGRVILVHVVDYLPAYDAELVPLAPPEEVEDEMTRAARDRLGDLKAAHPAVADVKVVGGRAWSTINELADDEGAALIVMGAHETVGFDALLGSTTDRVLHHAQRDVLVVKSSKHPGSGPRPPYRHVLAAVDFSARGHAAVLRAAQWAGGAQATLTLLHVVDHFPVDRSNEAIAPEDLDPEAFAQQAALQRLAELRDGIGLAEVEMQVEVSTGSAKRVVPAYAQAHDVDLVVIGSHGHYGLEVLLGTTADGVVHRAPCDVLVVRAPEAAG